MLKAGTALRTVTLKDVQPYHLLHSKTACCDILIMCHINVSYSFVQMKLIVYNQTFMWRT